MSLTLGGLAAEAGAQTRGERPPGEPPVARAQRIDQSPRLDGVLDDDVWRLTEPAADFVQQEPDEGAAARRRTEVRFLYDDVALYVGAMMYDDAPTHAVTNELKRDFDTSSGDLFGIILDTFLDRQNAYGFMTNPGGAQHEAQAYDNGQRSDANWNGAWTVHTAVRPDGWSVEAAIPFKTLRFPDRADQQWGLNLIRIVRRVNEVSTWSSVPRQFTPYHVGYAGALVGISSVQSGHNLRVTPFTTAQTRRTAAPGPWRSDADGGVDLKWAVTPSFVLDATLRTDFAQVEADEEQINLTRFNVRFPEKRQFFLESPGSFQIGLAGETGGPAANMLIPFFTRSIGLSENGEPIPVLGGARLTGRSGSTTVGLLNMQTDRHGSRPGDNFSVVRLSRDVRRGVALGGFYFGREANGQAAGPSGAFNRVFGGDLRVSPSRTLEIEGVLMRSASSGPDDDWTGRATARLRRNRQRASLQFLHVGDHFRHDMGYVRQRGIGMVFGDYQQVFRPDATHGWIREHAIRGEQQTILDDSYSQLLTATNRGFYTMGFADGGSFRAGLEHIVEQLPEAFELRRGFPIPAGRHEFGELILGYNSDRSSRLSMTSQINLGSFWTGTRRHGKLGLRWRANAHLAASAEYDREHITLASGAFVDDVAQFRIDWSLSTRMFLNAYLQYNGARNAWVSNVRFNFVHRPLSDVYVVWNEGWGTGASSHGIILKYTYALGL